MLRVLRTSEVVHVCKRSLSLQVLVGHPDYEVTKGSAVFEGKNLFDFEPEERSHLGLFLRYVECEALTVRVQGSNSI